jgi:hypothetical protein
MGHACLTVRPGQAYLANDGQYTVRPDQREDYDRVFAEMVSRHVQLRRIVHLWSVTAGAEGLTLDAALDRGFFSLIHLAQAVGDSSFTEPLALTTVSNGLQRVLGTEPLSPVKAPALALGQVIPREFPTISCQNIDIDPGEATDVLIEQLIVDIALNTEPGTYAYRVGQRWAETFEPMPIGPKEGIPSRLRKHGVYLITGGLGGLGLVVAKFLAETLQAKLVLTGRSGLPPRADWPHWLASHGEDDATSQRIQTVQELETLGAEVLVAQADVGDRAAMEQVAVQARERFGVVNGVFHAAGLPGGATIHLHSRDQSLQVLAPKMVGTPILEALFQGPELDFLVLFSSINSLVGFGGSIDYTAANLFLDRYATARHTPDTAVLSINWDAWQEVGMAAAAAGAAGRAGVGVLRHAIDSREGIEALCRVLDISVPQVAVITRSLSEVIERSRALDATINGQSQSTDLATDSALSQYARPDLAQDFVEPRNEHERFMADLWQELLGLDRIGIYDNFFELGGHSLLATSLLARIQKERQVKLQLRAIFDAPTVRELAERVAALSWATNAAPVSAGGESREEFEL